MCSRWTKPRSNLEAGTDTVPGTTPQYYLIGQIVPDAFDIIAHSHSNHNLPKIEWAHKEVFHSMWSDTTLQALSG